MGTSGKWKRMLVTGLAASALFAGSALGAEKMQAQKSTASRRIAVENPRVVGFKTEQTDSWLCEYVSPFFCSSIPTIVAAPQPGTTTTSRRGRQ
jgi:hypothetical protein